MARTVIFAFLLVLGLLFSGAALSRPAEAEHGVAYCGGDGQKACLSLVSPMIKDAIYGRGQITWCLDSRASEYPNFRAQVTSVMAVFSVEVGVPTFEVPYASDGSCDVRHSMPDTHKCNGCSAWVYTQLFPVLIEYKWQLGYTFWDSTIDHEFLHAACLLDEHYDKIGFRSYFNTFGQWIHGAPTGMDVGVRDPLYPGDVRNLWRVTAYDRERCWETLLPNQVREAGIAYGTYGVFLYYCGADARADRVVVMAQAPTGEMYYSGRSLGALSTCIFVPLVSEPGWCFYFNSEIRYWWTSWQRPDMRNDALAGCA